MNVLAEKLKALGALLLAIATAGTLLAIAAAPFAAAGGWAINASSRTMNSNLQDIGNNSSLPLLTTMTDRTGQPIAYFYKQYRIPVDSNQISQHVKDSIVAIEDRRFYEHTGVDLRGTLRAMASNFTKGDVAEGASTLDQQYVKNYLYFISAESEEQAQQAVATSIPRKLREMKMASEVDREFTKDDILVRYLNLIPYGHGAYGIEAAARTYFGIPAAELDPAQSAFLAGVVQSTAGLDPYAFPDAALDRRNTVLQARVATGTLTQQEADTYSQQPLGVLEQPQTLDLGCLGAGDSGFFCDYATDWLDKHGISADQLAQGGYTITTTLDPNAQKQAIQNARAQVDPKTSGVASVSSLVVPTTDADSTTETLAKQQQQAITQEHAATKDAQKRQRQATTPAQQRELAEQLAWEAQQRQHERAVKAAWSNSTAHEVVALASSRVYGLDDTNQETVLPLGHTLQGNGAGSVFKIFAAAAALERGAGLDTMLDVPRRVEVSGMGDGGARGCPAGKYCVENSADYRPTMTLRDALATSPNTPFVELAQTVGMERIVDLSVDLGLRSYERPGSFSEGVSIAEQMKKDNNASYVLGPTAVNPVELSNVAATLSDGGRWCEPSPILQVTDRDGKEVDLDVQDCEQVIQKEVADALANAMGDDTIRGSGEEAAKATGWGAPIASKTGTTESNMSAAFLGFVPGFAGSTYIFNDGATVAPLCTSPARQCTAGSMFGGKEPARTFLSIARSQVGRFTTPALPAFDQRFLVGRDPDAFRQAYDRRAENLPSQPAAPLVPELVRPPADAATPRRGDAGDGFGGADGGFGAENSDTPARNNTTNPEQGAAPTTATIPPSG